MKAFLDCGVNVRRNDMYKIKLFCKTFVSYIASSTDTFHNHLSLYLYKRDKLSKRKFGGLFGVLRSHVSGFSVNLNQKVNTAEGWCIVRVIFKYLDIILST